MKSINYEALFRIRKQNHLTEKEQAQLEEIARLKRISLKLNRIFTNQCNGYIKEVRSWNGLAGKYVSSYIEDKELEAKEEALASKLEKQAFEIADRNGWEIRVNSDPRGSAIKLNLVKDSSDINYIGTDTDLIV